MSVCTGRPEAFEPANTWTVIVGESPGTVPANPEKVGLPVLVVLPLAGFFTVTAGRARSTVHDARAGAGS